MSDILKAGKTIGKMKPLNAMIFALLVLSVLNTGLTQWSSVEDRKDRQDLLEQIVILNRQNRILIEDQAESKSIKKRVSTNYDAAEEQWRDTKIMIGNVLQRHNIGFPNDLNNELSKYDVKRQKIKDCLLFPES